MRGYLVKRDDRYYAVVYEGIDPLTRKEWRTWRPAHRPSFDSRVPERARRRRLGVPPTA
ncbi:MAG: hypothetical protein ACXVXJ_11885 [Mycobacteriaceae bacterium]